MCIHPDAGQLTILFKKKNESEHKNSITFNELFCLTTMTSELPKYLNEQLVVHLNVKQQE